MCLRVMFELVPGIDRAEYDAPRRRLPAYSKQRLGLLMSHLQQRPNSQSEAACENASALGGEQGAKRKAQRCGDGCMRVLCPGLPSTSLAHAG
jgi:hypothetical protein